MNLHEYQAKALLKEYGLAIPQGVAAHTVDEALTAADLLQSDRWVVKAQIHAGGRGKANGVRVVNSKEQLSEVARSLLHTRLVTYQTDQRGQRVNTLLIEEVCDINRELYLGAVVDRSSQRIVLIASNEGGVDIEAAARDSPGKIFKITIDPLFGVLPYQCRSLALQLHLTDEQARQFTKIAINLGKLFIAYDLSLIEINPLVITKSGDLLCLDAKINIDENALYRQEKIKNLRDPSQEDPRELLAREWELNYIALEGNIGCMVNGAGLAMATLDLIKLQGGNPANFLDVGGSASRERVKEAFKLILSDTKVKAVLINIFGGIVRCDLIAEGIQEAVAEVGIDVPVVVRLEGNQAEAAAKMLEGSGLNIIAARSFSEAAECVVQAAKAGKLKGRE